MSLKAGAPPADGMAQFHAPTIGSVKTGLPGDLPDTLRVVAHEDPMVATLEDGIAALGVPFPYSVV
jgi:hypothetical protein